jgi:hypothetical protein
MWPFALLLLASATACHSPSVRDPTHERTAQGRETAAQPASAPRAPLVASVSNPRAPELAPFGTSLPGPTTRPREDLTPARALDAEPRDDTIEHLRARVQALEAKVGHLQRVAREGRARTEITRPGLYSTWTLTALGLLMMIAISFAIVAIARAWRASSELSFLRARASLSR